MDENRDILSKGLMVVEDGFDLHQHSKDIGTHEFVKSSFEAVLTLHEQVVGSKNETIESVREENAFLKEALKSLQEIYEEDRVTIERLMNELDKSKEELEFIKRKYKLMWNQVVENFDKK